MRFDLTEEQKLLVDTVTRFLGKELPSTALRPWFRQASGDQYRAWWTRCGSLGWGGIFAPPGHGEHGPVSDVPLVDASLLAEAAGAALAPSGLVGTSAAVAALAADPELDHPALPGLLDCTTVAAFAIEEPGGVWELSELTTTARVDGADLVIDGMKVLVADAATADLFLVACRVDGGVGVVLVPSSSPGVSATDLAGLDLLRQYGTLRLDEVRVPRDALIGRADPARILQLATCLQLAETTGSLDKLFHLMLEYTRSRYAFGRPIGSFQALKHRIADILLWVEGCKGTVEAAVAAVADQSPDSDLLVSVAKAYVGERSVEIAQQCTQIFGGIGFTWEHDAHLHLRRATTSRSVLGTPEQHRARVVRLLDVKGEKRGDNGS